MSNRDQLIRIFRAAVAAVQPKQLLPQHLHVSGTKLELEGGEFDTKSGKIFVIGAGKAAAAMAVAVEAVIGDLIINGIVTTKYGHTLLTNRVKVIEAAHPVPDEQGVEATRKTLELIAQADENDLVICLISGGASALWCDLPTGITLEAMQSCFHLLLRSGATIQEMNIVRKHLSLVKGGQLVRACRARLVSLIISDVPGDDLSAIASGPTVPDPNSFKDAFDVITRFGLESSLPQSILAYLRKGLNAQIPDTPKPGDPLFKKVTNRIIGNNLLAVDAAANEARNLGFETLKVRQLITGEAEMEVRRMLQLAKQHLSDRPICLVQGGETTVRVTRNGKGGRAQHFVLTAVSLLQKPEFEILRDHITILCGGTDGTDGPTDAAGAIADHRTIEKARQLKLSPEAFAADYNAYEFFSKTGDMLITGPTQTNVMDIMLAIVT